MVEMGRICNRINGLKPTVMMVSVQISGAGLNVFFKLAANDGMSMSVLVAYRFLFAAAVILPLALCVERKSRPNLTWKIGFQAFFIALFGGALAQNLYAKSLVITSPTFVAAMSNLIPAITFILALLFRMERLGLATNAGKAKLIGTLTSIAGAMLLTFYKGPAVDMWSTGVDLLQNGRSGHVAASPSSHQPSVTIPVLGPLLALASCLAGSLALIVQAKMSADYPCLYSSTALLAGIGSLQAVAFAISTERDWSQWKLGWNIRLLTVAYSGAIASGIMQTFIMWCVRMRGPVFVSVFSPLVLILVAIAGSLLYNDKLHLGSVIGSVIIIVGLYIVIWGKGKEIKRIAQLMPSNSSTTPIHDGDDDTQSHQNHTATTSSNSTTRHGSKDIIESVDIIMEVPPSSTTLNNHTSGGGGGGGEISDAR